MDRSPGRLSCWLISGRFDRGVSEQVLVHGGDDVVPVRPLLLVVALEQAEDLITAPTANDDVDNGHPHLHVVVVGCLLQLLVGSLGLLDEPCRSRTLEVRNTASAPFCGQTGSERAS